MLKSLSRLLIVVGLLSAQLSAEICFDFGSSMRYDRLDWSIAGFDDTPNILSELKWRDLEIFQLEGQITYSNDCNWFMRLDGDYGWIYKGRNTDADYAGNDRTNIFSLAKTNAGRGNVWDVSLGGGYAIELFQENFSITPLLGISVNAQQLTMYDGELIINELFDFLGPFDGLHNTYETVWYGPWIGFDLFYKPSEIWNIWSNFEYHWARYEGTGHWNLRADIMDDFHHIANAQGFLIRTGILYHLTENWIAGLRGSYQIWTTTCGSDHMTFSGDGIDDSGEPISLNPLTISTKLNPVHWQSWTYSASISYTF